MRDDLDLDPLRDLPEWVKTLGYALFGLLLGLSTGLPL